MSQNIINQIVVNTDKTIGTDLLLLNVKPYSNYIDGIRGNQEGITCTVLSEKMGFDKINIKIPGLLELPFEFTENIPLAVSFQGLKAKLWQDWNNKGEVKLSITAEAIKVINDKHNLKISGEKA